MSCKDVGAGGGSAKEEVGAHKVRAVMCNNENAIRAFIFVPSSEDIRSSFVALKR